MSRKTKNTLFSIFSAILALIIFGDDIGGRHSQRLGDRNQTLILLEMGKLNRLEDQYIAEGCPSGSGSGTGREYMEAWQRVRRLVIGATGRSAKDIVEEYREGELDDESLTIIAQTIIYIDIPLDDRQRLENHLESVCPPGRKGTLDRVG